MNHDAPIRNFALKKYCHYYYCYKMPKVILIFRATFFFCFVTFIAFIIYPLFHALLIRKHCTPIVCSLRLFSSFSFLVPLTYFFVEFRYFYSRSCCLTLFQCIEPLLSFKFSVYEFLPSSSTRFLLNHDCFHRQVDTFLYKMLLFFIYSFYYYYFFCWFFVKKVLP